MRGSRPAAFGSRLGWLVLIAAVSAAPAASALVYTKSSGNVDAGGGAHYAIPITVPPGTFGMVPTLSLTYTSNGGNGHLGVGWVLEGVGAITRCPSSLVNDGIIGGVRIATTDRFCLNGQRLVVKGTGTYGANDTEYRTDTESFTKVISFGSAGTGPAWFKVWMKNGLIMEYGNTADSLVEATGTATARLWALNKVQDRQGNYYTVTYNENTSTGEFTPSRIDYTGNAAAGLAPYNSVRFLYEARPDEETLFLASSQILQSTRMTRVQTYADSDLVKDYRLTYEPGGGTGRSRVATVTECAGDGACMPALSFNYQNGGGGITAAGAPHTSLGNLTSPQNPVATHKGDFNGDGVQDLLIVDHWSQGRICYGPAFLSSECTAPWNLGTDTGVHIGDFDGDGKSDVLSKFATGDLYLCYGPQPWTGSGECHAVGRIDQDGTNWVNYDIVVADFDGDGRSDLFGWDKVDPRKQWGMYCSSVNLTSNYAWPQPLPLEYAQYCNGRGMNGKDYKAHLGDFDGDGLKDILFAGATNYRICTGRALSTGAYVCTNIASTLDWKNSATVVPGDFNGDGNDDVILLTANGAQKCAGPGLLSANNCTQLAGTSDDWKTIFTPIVGDMNGDGTIDLYLASAASTFFCKGPGIWSANNCAPINSLDWRTAKALVGDFNGDGTDDVVTLTGTSLAIGKGGVVKPDLLTTATNTAFGNAHSFTYKPLTDSTVYTKGADAPYPQIDVQVPMHVVSQSTFPNGIGGSNTKNHKYEKARVDYFGRGWLGFAIARVTDVASGREEVTTRLQNYPHIGVISDVKTYVGGQMVRNQTRTVQSGNSFEGRPFTLLIYSLDSISGLDGVYRSEKRSYGGDTYGNSLGSSLYINEFSNTVLKEIESATAVNDASQWLFGQVTWRQLQRWGTVWDQIIQQTNYTYKPGTFLVQQETREPNDAPLQVVTTNVHDAFGNVTSQTVTPNAMDARVTSSTYDSRGRFVATSTNPLGHVFSQLTEGKFGVVTSATDPNNLTTTWQIDSFGRKILESRPDASTITWGYQTSFAANPHNPSPAYRVSRLVTGSASPSYVYFDSVDRELLTQQINFGGTGWVEDKNTWYDANGRVIRKYLGYDQGAATPPYKALAYDSLGRKSQETAADGGVKTYAYTAQPSGGPVTTTVTAPGNKVTKYVSTLHDELVEIIDTNNRSTTYEISALGKTAKTVDSLGNQTTATFNKYGWMISRNDLGFGVWNYTFDALGKLATQTDAKSQATTFVYDKLERQTQRIEPSQTSTCVWDTANKGIGKLSSCTTSGGTVRSFTYDIFGRQATELTQVDGITYSIGTTYDAAGRPEVTTYPSGFSVRNVYNTRSYLSEVRNNTTNALLWKVVAATAQGVTEEDFGNGTGISRTFHSQTSRPIQITGVRDSDNSILINQAFSYDQNGNLTTKSESTQSVSETFGYDGLNRLTSVAGPAPKSFTYNELGNLTSKSDVGTYTYPTTGKVHAVTSAGPTALTYDANGSVVTSGNRTITWASFNLPLSVSRNGGSYTWTYDDALQRVKFVTPIDTTIYVARGNTILFEKVSASGSPEQKSYIYAHGRAVALHIERTGSPTETKYFVQDLLGSTVLVGNDQGVVTERLSYDAHGKRRYPSGIDDVNNILAGSATDRGYTYHEHLDALGLIHMNGRIYDPLLGRFLSADPEITDPKNTQNLNRYSYVLNSPLRYTDPTGFDWWADFLAWLVRPVDGPPPRSAAIPLGRLSVVGVRDEGLIIVYGSRDYAPASGPGLTNGLGGAVGGNTRENTGGGVPSEGGPPPDPDSIPGEANAPPCRPGSGSNPVADAVVGFGDAFGAGLIRNALNIDGSVDFNSMSYDFGSGGGLVAGFFTGGVFLAGVAGGSTRVGYRLLNSSEHIRFGRGTWQGRSEFRVSSRHLYGDGHYRIGSRLPVIPPAGALRPPRCRG